MKKRLLITGISSGIGLFLSQKLNENYNITGLGRNNPNINGVTFIEGDLQKPLEVKISEKYDYVILNAGVGYFDKFDNIKEEQIIEMLNVNLLSNIIITKRILSNYSPLKLIYIGTIAGKKFLKYGGVYSASKFGLRGFVGSLKNELTKTKVHIINPGIVDTNFFANSKISIPGIKKTGLEEILETVINILENKEKRFEIDLYC